MNNLLPDEQDWLKRREGMNSSTAATLMCDLLLSRLSKLRMREQNAYEFAAEQAGQLEALCTCPTTAWTGDNMSDSTCLLSEEAHELIRKRNPATASSPAPGEAMNADMLDVEQLAEEFRWNGEWPALCDMKAVDLKRLMAAFAKRYAHEFAAEQLEWLESAEMGSANAMRLRYLCRIRAAELRGSK